MPILPSRPVATVPPGAAWPVLPSPSFAIDPAEYPDLAKLVMDLKAGGHQAIVRFGITNQGAEFQAGYHQGDSFEIVGKVSWSPASGAAFAVLGQWTIP